MNIRSYYSLSLTLVLTCTLHGCSAGGQNPDFTNHDMSIAGDLSGLSGSDLASGMDLRVSPDLPGVPDLATGADLLPPPATGAALWQKQVGGTGQTLLYAAAADSSGSAFAVGSFSGTIDLGGGPLKANGTNSDIFVVKLATNGSHLWSKRYGNNRHDEARAVAVDKSDNVYVLGSFQGSVDFGGGPLTAAGSSDVYIVKLSSAGGFLWAKRFGAFLDNSIYGAAVDKDGNLLLTGSFAGSIDFGGGSLPSSGGTDAFLAKLAADGSHLWSKRYGGGEAERGHSVTSDSDGNVFFTGAFRSTTDFGGGSKTPRGGTASAFLVKLDPSGAYRWEKIIVGDFATVDTQSVAADSKGSVLLAGQFYSSNDFGGGTLSSSGDADIFVAKYGPTGTYQWAIRGGGSNSEMAAGIAVDRADQVIVAGRYTISAEFGGSTLTSAGGEDIFVAKYAPTGSHLWSRGFGSTSVDYSTTVAVVGFAELLIGGMIHGPTDFGGGVLTPTGNPDSFLLRRAP